MNDIGALDLYLYDFQVTPVMAEMNESKKRIMTTALETYIDYLKWQLTEDAITSEPLDLEELQDEQEEIDAIRTIEDVKKEIEILRKWHKDIPDELIREYNSLKNKV